MQLLRPPQELNEAILVSPGGLGAFHVHVDLATQGATIEGGGACLCVPDAYGPSECQGTASGPIECRHVASNGLSRSTLSLSAGGGLAYAFKYPNGAVETVTGTLTRV